MREGRSANPGPPELGVDSTGPIKGFILAGLSSSVQHLEEIDR